MKILFVNINSIHPKNLHSILNYKNISFDFINNIQDINQDNLLEYDAVYSPGYPINVSKFPNTKFIFGPHFSVFPEKNQMHEIMGKNVIYTQPSKWVVDLWNSFSICKNIRIKELPFGVDTNRFTYNKPIIERTKVFLYYKNRNENDFNQIVLFLQKNNINYKIFHYGCKYPENEYFEYLQNSKYGIWLGRHESQGFALEEALSCNVPLFVWDVRSMNQESGCYYDDLPGTVIPYWDERCGEYFYDFNEIDNKFKKFLFNINNNAYKPREYILENLSMDVCEKRFINLIKEI